MYRYKTEKGQEKREKPKLLSFFLALRNAQRSYKT